MHYSRDRKESTHKPKRTAVCGRMNTYIAGYKSLPVSLQFCVKEFGYVQQARIRNVTMTILLSIIPSNLIESRKVKTLCKNGFFYIILLFVFKILPH